MIKRLINRWASSRKLVTRVRAFKEKEHRSNIWAGSNSASFWARPFQAKRWAVFSGRKPKRVQPLKRRGTRQAGWQSNDKLPLFAVKGYLTGASWGPLGPEIGLMDRFLFGKSSVGLFLAQFGLPHLYIINGKLFFSFFFWM